MRIVFELQVEDNAHLPRGYLEFEAEVARILMAVHDGAVQDLQAGASLCTGVRYTVEVKR